jgi:hypothetical protein
MERFTATSYEMAMQLAKEKYENGFEVINTRQMNLSNSGLSDEMLFEITISPIKKIPEIIKMDDKTIPKFSELMSLIKQELKPIHDFQMEISLLRKEIDLLSRRVNKLIHPELDLNERPIYDALHEIGFENPLALRFTRELSYFDNNTITLQDITKSFDNIFQKLIQPISLKDGDAIVLFGQSNSGKSKASELIADELFNTSTVHIRKKIDLNEKNKDGITIIDSPSIRFDEMGAMQNLSKLVNSYKKISRVLVISASTGYEEMLHLIASFAPIKPNYILFTKFDETIQPGKLLNILNETGLKVCGLTYYSDNKIKYTNDSMTLFIQAISKNLGYIN